MKNWFKKQKYEIVVHNCMAKNANRDFSKFQKEGFELAGNISPYIHFTGDQCVQIPLKRKIKG